MSLFFDVVIAGGGLVGASLAAALGPSGLSVGLVDPQEFRPLPSDGSWDARVYAISPGCAGFLSDCGAWQHLPQARVARIERMRVYGDDLGACLEFDAYEAGLRELAFIVENRLLHDALWRQLQAATHVRLIRPARCTEFERRVDSIELRLEDGTRLRTRLLVGADGIDSWVRAAAGIAASSESYGQLGVVANFATAAPHREVAFQWFRKDGVLALLPLPGDRVSMVWSTDEAHGRELMACASTELAARVEAASQRVLGALELIAPPASFPLQLQRVTRLVQPRIALVGDAAHNVHPLAGQGVNLGFRDVRTLAAVLRDRGMRQDCGDYFLLRRYERARREDILALELVTDGLQKLFAREAVWAGRVRNLGLKLVDNLPPLKNLLVRHAVA